MSYSRNKNITMIDDLIDLEDNPPIQNTSSISGLNTNKFIRNSGGGQMTIDSGMSPYNQSNQLNMNPNKPNQYFPPPKQTYPGQAPNSPSQPPQLKINNIQAEISTPNCIDIHNHVTQCPICSKFFKFDNSVYIISIIVLSIICILLLKKVLNV